MLKILADLKRINDALFPPRPEPDPDCPRIDAEYLRQILKEEDHDKDCNCKTRNTR